MTIQELHERLIKYGLKDEVTDAVIENADSVYEFREWLYCSDAWYDIYGPGENSDYLYLEEHGFETEEYHTSYLPRLERMIWQDALIRNGKINWMSALYP